MYEYNPREVFEKVKCNKKCKDYVFLGCFLRVEQCYNEYLKKLVKLMLKSLIATTTRLKVYHNKQSEPEVLEMIDIVEAEYIIEQVIQKKIEEVVK